MNKKIVQKKPNLFFYFFLGGLVIIISKIIMKLKLKGEKPKGPALVISNHTSNIDWIIEGTLVFPNRMTFLVTYYFFTFRFIGFLLKKIVRAIPKYQFATDLASLKKIKSVLNDEKGLVFIAPEGTVWGSGKLGYIPLSICKLIKMLKVPVYASKIQGAGLGCAKWSKHLHRTKIQTYTSLLFTSEEINQLSLNQMHEKIIQALNYNEFDFQKTENISVKSKNLAEGFETLFFICPHCLSEFTLKTFGNTIQCKNCNTIIHLNKNFRFEWSTEIKYFDNYTEWYDWQLCKMIQTVQKKYFSFEQEVDYGTDIQNYNNYKKVGHGLMKLTHSGWDYTGTFNGEFIHEHDELYQVPLAVLKPGVHFELPYRFSHSRVFYPENGLHAAKWHILSRAISIINNGTLLAENEK